MPQPFTKYSLICSSRGSLAHNHAGWQLLHGSSAQKAQICRCDSKSVDAFQSYSSLKTDNFFLLWYVIWFSIQNLGGPPWFHHSNSFCLLELIFWKIVFYWLSLECWGTAFIFSKIFPASRTRNVSRTRNSKSCLPTASQRAGATGWAGCFKPVQNLEWGPLNL